MSDPFRSDLLAAQTRVERLEAENLRLRAGLDDDAMRKTRTATRIATAAVVAALLTVVGLGPSLVSARADAERLRAELSEQSRDLALERAQSYAALAGANTVRRAPAPAPAYRAPATPVNAVSLGCFVDRGDASPGTSGRDLDGRVFVMNGLTPQGCIDRCATEGFEFAGVQYANQCFCGHAYGRFGSAPAQECNAVCAGDAQQSCGGTWRNTVYELAKKRD